MPTGSPFSRHPCSSSNPRLVERTQTLLQAGLAATTTALYRTGSSRYEAFAQQEGIRAYPTSEHTLCLFVTHLCAIDPTTPSRRTVSAATARLYIAGVYHAQEMLGIRVDGSKFRVLAQTLRGAEKQAPSLRPPRPTRVPITIRDITDAAVHLPRTYTGIMCVAAMYVAVGAALRISELLGQMGVSPSNADSRALRLSQLRELPSPHPHFVLTIFAHKTDQRGQGTEIVIGHPQAVDHIRMFLASHPKPSDGDARGPLLFVFPDGIPLSSRYLLLVIRPAFASIGIDPRGISGHSFRKGGATGLANAGVDDSLVRAHGRWKSNAYLRYIVPSRSSLINATRKSTSDTSLH